MVTIFSYLIVGTLSLLVIIHERQAIEDGLAANICVFAGFSGFSVIPSGFGLQLSFLFGAMLLSVQFKRGSAILLRSRWLSAWICIVFLSSAMSYAIPGPVDGMYPWRKSLTQAIAHFGYVVLLTGIANCALSTAKVIRLLRYLLYGAIGSAAFGLMQPTFVATGRYDLADLFWNNPSYGGVLAQSTGNALRAHTAESTLGVFRIWGPAMEPSYLGCYLSLAILAWIGTRQNAVQVFRRSRWLGYFGCVICIVALIATQARMALIAFAVALIGYAVSRAEMRVLLKRASALVVVVLIGILAMSALAAIVDVDLNAIVRERFGFFASSDHVSDDYSAGARLAGFLISVEIVKDYPLLGVGVGNYGFHVYDYIKPEHKYYEFGAGAWHVPFGWLASTLADTGFLGLVALVGFFWEVFSGSRRVCRELQWRFLDGLWWGTAGLLVAGMAGTQFPGAYWWVAVGILLGVEQNVRRKLSPVAYLTRALAPPVAAALCGTQSPARP